MSETETTVQMDDKDLFQSATSPDAPATEAPATEAKAEQTDAGPARDEHGRFAPKVEQPAQAETAKPAEQEKQPEPGENQPGWVPAWRKAEIAEARRVREDRAAAIEQRNQELERYVHQLNGQLRQYTEKPAEAVDPFADPEKFADQRARQAVDPVQSEVAQIREHYSRKDAIRNHGEETFNAAFDWLRQADRSGDPRAQAFIARVKMSIDPFEEIVTAFKRDKALSTVGDDPNAWFEKELERRMADPEFKAKLGQPQSQGTSPANIVKLPPSLNRTAGTNPSVDTGDMSDASLFAYAAR